jgi:hypothetical protein
MKGEGEGSRPRGRTELGKETRTHGGRRKGRAGLLDGAARRKKDRKSWARPCGRKDGKRKARLGRAARRKKRGK